MAQPASSGQDESIAFVIGKGGTVDRQLPDREELRLISTFPISTKDLSSRKKLLKIFGKISSGCF